MIYRQTGNRYIPTDEECNQSLFLTGDHGNNGGGMDDSTHLDGAIQGDTTETWE